MMIMLRHKDAMYELRSRGKLGVLTKIELPEVAFDLATCQYFDVSPDGTLKARQPTEDEMVAYLTAHVRSNNEQGAGEALARVWPKLSAGLRARAAHAYAVKAGVPTIRLPS